MLILEIIFFFILGCIVGSFLNVVVERINLHKSFLIGRSACPQCHHVLGFFDLIPLFSYIFLLGKCRYCRKEIAGQYFWVELLTGAVFGLIFVGTLHATSVQYALSIHNIFLLFFYLIIACFLIIIFLYDFKYYLILDKIIVPAVIVAIIGNLLLGSEWWDLGLGALIGGGIFFLQYIISRGKWIGGGDIRLGLLMGAILGWQLTFVALFIAYLIGAFIGIILIIGKQKKMKDAVPFGTFLSIATLIALLYGNIILNWYINLII